MAASSAAEPHPAAGSPEVLQWLRNLPVAPEYHPTAAEFQDPISYIFKIEKEASKYGICKIVPPVLSANRKTAVSNLNRSLADRSGAFTSRQQQIGFCPRKPRPIQKPVWQSGELYTFQEFEAKAKSFEKNYLKKISSRKGNANLTPLEIETLFWKATLDKPFSVEYANDMPGSAFSQRRAAGEGGPSAAAEGATVGDTEWNMRGVSRAKGSLLRFMKEEIPGVTSPMLYIAMMFSWFAWHVEDHDLHSLNYLHLGAGKTWYGVPREAAASFEEVVRVQGYGGEINPLVTFAVLGEKTTVMSPEIFIRAGVPCCRLVQNAGEFVVTFPRAYHSGFSHGFNCGEAANVATPEWLKVAKDAAIRRASINCPPMVSHFQLLYDLALELCTTRVPVGISGKPRSSRLKDKQKGEGETMVKEQFVKYVIQNNDLLYTLGQGSSVVILPQSSSDVSVSPSMCVGSHLRLNPSLGVCSRKGLMKSSKSLASDDIVPEGNNGINRLKRFVGMKGKFASFGERSFTLDGHDNTGAERESTVHGDKLSDQRLFSCVTCGILIFDCVAIIQPTDATARYLMSSGCSFFNDWITGSGVTNDKFAVTGVHTSEQNSSTRLVEKQIVDGLYDVPVQSVDYQIQKGDLSMEESSDSKTKRESSALGLLALNYGNLSDSDEDQVDPDIPHSSDEINKTKYSSEGEYQFQYPDLPSFKQECHDVDGGDTQSRARIVNRDAVPLQTFDYYSEQGQRSANFKDRGDQHIGSFELDTNSLPYGESNNFERRIGDPMLRSQRISNCFTVAHDTERTKFSTCIAPAKHTDASFVQRSDEDSSRMHVFCLEHAVEVEQQLRPIGGVHILLLCHPEYPRIETAAKLVCNELEMYFAWNNISFRDASKEDEERIQLALDSEDAISGNGDWAVKLGINLFYSANLSWSTLYSKQMAYNSVIYNAFGRTVPANSPTKFNVYERRTGKQKKEVVGKWCGKVWMSDKVHPLLAKLDPEDQYLELHNLATPEETLERKHQNTLKSETKLGTGKSARKRKMTIERGSTKKGKHLENEDAASDDSAENVKKHYIHGAKQKGRVSLEDNAHQQHLRIHRSKVAKSFEREDLVSDYSFEDNSYQRYRRRTLSSKQAKAIPKENVVSYDLMQNNSEKHYSRVPVNKRVRCVVREDAVSDDSIENAHLWQGSDPKSSQTKLTVKECEFSDDSLEENSHWPHGRITVRTPAKYIEKEDAVSDNSLENASHLQIRKISRGNPAKCINKEDVLSECSMEEDHYQQHTRFSRIKQAKLSERDGTDSDFSVEDNVLQQHKGILSGKQVKFVQWEDAVSDDSLEDNTHRQHRIILGGKRARYVEDEVAVSDELMGGHTHQEHRRTPRSKDTNSFQRENEVLDDMQEDNFHQQHRKSPRAKQAKVVRREDAVSDDALEGKSNQQQGRVLRSKQKKSVNLSQKKQVTRNMKQGTSQLIKKETPELVKEKRPTKREAARLWRDKSEQNTKQFESRGKEELGGPSTRLRKRPSKSSKQFETKLKAKQKISGRKLKNAVTLKALTSRKKDKMKDEEAEYQCDIDGCTMCFGSKQELALHRRNVCPVKGCEKKFISHKYLVQHRRVHMDDRPLKCPWKGCKMTFKWAWARTEHIRVHTGARPYVCAEEGCGQTFRFVSDFSRHKRKTGHSKKKIGGNLKESVS